MISKNSKIHSIIEGDNSIFASIFASFISRRANTLKYFITASCVIDASLSGLSQNSLVSENQFE